MKLFNLNTYDIAMILSDIFTVFVAHKFFSIFSTEKRSVKITRLLYVLYGIAIIISSVFIDIPIVNLIVTIITVSAIALSYKIEYKKAFLTIALYCFILFIGELLAGSITGRIIIQPLMKTEYNDVFGLFLCKVGTFLVVLLLLENSRLLKGNHTPPAAYLFATLFMPSSSIAVEAMIVSINGVTKPIVLFSMGILILINMLTFTLYDKISIYYENQMETASLKQENLFYHNQLKSMNESVNDTRAFRHDIQNHFNMIEGYLKANKFDEAISYLQELKKSNIMSADAIVNTGNFIVDSVMNYKLSTIQDLNIDTNLEIFIPQKINIDTVHFVSILTNLLDNAIEALRSMEESDNKILRIRIAYTKGRLMILFQNSYEGDIVYEDGSICSSKTDAEAHGYGLENVKKALEPYNGLLKITHNGGIFSIQALLYLC
ncbi:MAG: GHKL domain-containing protein [Ruminococcus sp.]|nr:GHKL domain-containing protein [Ruminococcus sp.]